MQKYAGSFFFSKSFTWISNYTVYSKLCVLYQLLFTYNMLQIIWHSSQQWKQPIRSEGCCVFSISFKVFSEQQFRSKRNTIMSSNSFGRKVWNLCHSLQQHRKWFMTKKKIIFFYVSLVVSTVLEDDLLKWRDKWFCVFLLLIKNKLPFLLFVCKILLFYDQ